MGFGNRKRGRSNCGACCWLNPRPCPPSCGLECCCDNGCGNGCGNGCSNGCSNGCGNGMCGGVCNIPGPQCGPCGQPYNYKPTFNCDINDPYRGANPCQPCYDPWGNLLNQIYQSTFPPQPQPMYQRPNGFKYHEKNGLCVPGVGCCSTNNCNSCPPSCNLPTIEIKDCPTNNCNNCPTNNCCSTNNCNNCPTNNCCSTNNCCPTNNCNCCPTNNCNSCNSCN